MEQDTDRLSVVDTPDRLGKDWGNIDHVELGGFPGVVILRNGIGDNKFVNGRCVHAAEGITTEHSVCDKRINFACASGFQKLGRTGDGMSRVCKIVDKNAYPLTDVSNQHHGALPALVVVDCTSLLEYRMSAKTNVGSKKGTYLVDECK